MLGEEPAERHEHYDAEGNLTGYTVVIREPEWDDEERDKMLALAEYEAGVCQGCGLHHSFTDLDPWVTIEDRTCPVCRSIAPQLRVFADEDAKHAEALHEQPKAHGVRDGKTRVLRVLSPLEAMEAQRRASTEASPTRRSSRPTE